MGLTISQVTRDVPASVFVPGDPDAVFREAFPDSAVRETINQGMRDAEVNLGGNAADTFGLTQDIFENLDTLTSLFSGQGSEAEGAAIVKLSEISQQSAQNGKISAAALESLRLIDLVRNTSLQVYGTGNAF